MFPSTPNLRVASQLGLNETPLGRKHTDRLDLARPLRRSMRTTADKRGGQERTSKTFSKLIR
jgi:hypothetical protein